MEPFNITKLFSVKDMVFVVTGGGSGLGASMAQAFAANGAAKVFILGRRQESLKKIAATGPSGIMIPIVCDISSKDALLNAANEIKDRTPFINTLIANSGTTGEITSLAPRPAETTLAELQAQLWATSQDGNQKTLNTNVLGSFYTFLAFVNLLDAGNKHPESVGIKGYIPSQFIAITSIAGLARTEMVSHTYAIGKAALVHLTKMISTNFAGYNIRANSIAPGTFVTEMTEAVFDGKDMSVPGSIDKGTIPGKRTGSVEDIAGAALFLASRAGGFVNGSVLVLDGGGLSLVPAAY